MGFVSDIIGDITGANKAADAASEAGQLQYQGAMAGVDENRRQFDKMVELLSPYVTAGTGALSGQQNILGLNGDGAQQGAVDAIQNSPLFQSLNQQGQSAILQNASATGGLRGGNTQGALAQFSPQLLNQMIEQQYNRLGGLSQMGQSAAAGQSSAGLQSANSISNLLQQGSAAQAGGVLAQGNTGQQGFGSLLGIGGALLGSGALGGLGSLFGGGAATGFGINGIGAASGYTGAQLGF